MSPNISPGYTRRKEEINKVVHRRCGEGQWKGEVKDRRLQMWVQAASAADVGRREHAAQLFTRRILMMMMVMMMMMMIMMLRTTMMKMMIIMMMTKILGTSAY